MGAGKRGGNGEVADLTVRVLREIRKELVGLRRDTNERLDRLEHRFERLEQATVPGLAELRNRFDLLLDFAGGR